MEMTKKEAKEQYLKMQLSDPNTSEWEKERIRQRFGIFMSATESDFTNKRGNELFEFVSRYLNSHLTRIRQQKRTNSPFEFLSENLKLIYHLNFYSDHFEDDTLEQIYDTPSEEDYNYLSRGFEKIGRPNEALLTKSILKKKTITEKEIKKLQDHFWDSDTIVQEIDTAIEKFIISNIAELVQLQIK